MNVHQPSLWDNAFLENGYRCLYALEFDEAVMQFRQALQAGSGEEDAIQTAIEICRYWKERLQQLPAQAAFARGMTGMHSRIAQLLEDYVHYHFTYRLTGFKKVLLRYIAGFLSDLADMDAGNVEITFDLLLELKDYRRAEHLVSRYREQHPGDHLMLYHLAQAQWLGNHKIEAKANYARALLYHPDEKSVCRIEYDDLKQLISFSGLAMAPAYGWARDILPLVHINDEMETINEEHEHAVEGYRLMQEADRSLKNNDWKSSVNYRKLLRKHARALYNEYFNLLERRKA